MQYLALLYSDEDARPNPEKPGFDKVMQGYAHAGKTFRESGVFLGAAPLQPVKTATSVRVRNGQTQTMDGPFAETKEQLGGYYVFECENLDEALKYAAMIPVEDTGTVEVRPIMDLSNMG